MTFAGEYAWVVGPPEAMGMGLGLTYRGERQVVTAKLDVRPLPSPFCRPQAPLCRPCHDYADLRVGTRSAWNKVNGRLQLCIILNN